MASSQNHAPYKPQIAVTGGTPTVAVDVPICAVFVFLFITAAAANGTINQLNMRKGHKFLISGLLFGFCMARVGTNVMRIAWACYPEKVTVSIAAMIFTSAGVLILFLINLALAQRIVRATHPRFGWHRAVHYGFVVMYVLILLMLIASITAVVQSFYTLNFRTKTIDGDVSRSGSAYYMAISFLPIPVVILSLLIPSETRPENFGSGRWSTKIWMLLLTSVLLCLGASFRLGTAFKNARPIDHPAWYQARWCFYFFNFTLEYIVVFVYLVLRVDQRFHVPDGSHGPGDYSRKAAEGPQRDEERASTLHRDMSEERVFDDKMPKPFPTDEETGPRSEYSTLHSQSRADVSAVQMPKPSSTDEERRPRSGESTLRGHSRGDDNTQSFDFSESRKKG